MTLPTQFELATLAAAIPIKRAFKYDGGMPNETFKDDLSYRAHPASDLWRICEQVIEAAPNMVALMAEKAALIREAEFRLSLNELLNRLMPRTKKKEQKRWWLDYRTKFLGDVDQKTKDEAEGIGSGHNRVLDHPSEIFTRAGIDRVAKDAVQGFPLQGIKTIMEHFHSWKKNEQRKINTVKRSQGGQATSAKNPEKKASNAKKKTKKAVKSLQSHILQQMPEQSVIKQTAEEYKEASLIRKAKEKNKKDAEMQELEREILMAQARSTTKPANGNLPPESRKPRIRRIKS